MSNKGRRGSRDSPRSLQAGAGTVLTRLAKLRLLPGNGEAAAHSRRAMMLPVTMAARGLFAFIRFNQSVLTVTSVLSKTQTEGLQPSHGGSGDPAQGPGDAHGEGEWDEASDRPISGAAHVKCCI